MIVYILYVYNERRQEMSTTIKQIVPLFSEIELIFVFMTVLYTTIAIKKINQLNSDNNTFSMCIHLFFFFFIFSQLNLFFVFRIMQFIRTLLKNKYLVDREVTCGQRTILLFP